MKSSTAFLAQAGASDWRMFRPIRLVYEKSQLIDEKKEFETGQIELCGVYKCLHCEGICRGNKRTGLFKG